MSVILARTESAMAWLPLLASVATCLFELSLAILIGVRIWRDVPASTNTRSLRPGQPDPRVLLAILSVAVSSGMILFTAGRLLIVMGPQVGGFAAAIFLAHAVLFPILWVSCVRTFQECRRPARRAAHIKRTKVSWSPLDSETRHDDCREVEAVDSIVDSNVQSDALVAASSF